MKSITTLTLYGLFLVHLPWPTLPRLHRLHSLAVHDAQPPTSPMISAVVRHRAVKGEYQAAII